MNANGEAETGAPKTHGRRNFVLALGFATLLYLATDAERYYYQLVPGAKVGQLLREEPGASLPVDEVRSGKGVKTVQKAGSSSPALGREKNEALHSSSKNTGSGVRDLGFTDKGGCPAPSDPAVERLRTMKVSSVARVHAPFGSLKELNKIDAVQVHLLPEFNSFIPNYKFPNSPVMGGVIALRNAYVSGAHGMAFDCAASVFAGGCHPQAAKFPEWQIQWQAKGAVKLGKAVNIVQMWGHGWYHHFVEDFTRLSMVHDYLVQNPDVKILTYNLSNTPALLEMIGLDPARVVPYDGKRIYFAKQLLIPTANPCGHVASKFAAWTNEQFTKRLAKWSAELGTSKNESLNIVVQDRGKGQRALKNFAELVQGLRDAFPEATVNIFPPRLGLKEGALMHFAADLIVGPHGAGISNVLFTRKHAAVIEIHPNKGNWGGGGPHEINFCHQFTCRALGRRYAAVVANNGNYLSMFTADVAAVVKAAKKILSSSRKEVRR